MITETSVRSGSSARLRMTPARALTLAVGVPVLLALIGFTGLSTVANIGQASFHFHTTIPVSGGKVTAQVNGGNITLRQTAVSGGRAELTGTAGYSLIRSTVTVSGSGVSYRCPFQMSGSCYLNATLQVPAHTGASLSTFGGDVAVPGFTGSRLTLNTDGGNVEAGDLADVVDLSTAGGDVTVSSLNGSLNANTDGGNLNIESTNAPRAVVASGGGDVSLVYDAAPDSLQVSSDGGNITVVLPPGQYNLHTNTDGGTLSTSNAVADNPLAPKSIVLQSSGGDITIDSNPAS